MSLTHSDLQKIRTIVEEVVSPLSGEIQALTNDIKEIYDMIADLQKEVIDIMKNLLPDKLLEKLTIEQKLLKLNTELLAAAKQVGVSLPR